jgi:1-acyl-sn-glycerol-3-phosphate acyltransferase
VSRFFISIYHYFKKRKLTVFGIVIILFVVSVYFADKIKLEEDITSFMPGTPETERTNFVLRNISINDKIIVRLSVNDSSMPGAQDYLISCADTLVDSLKVNPGEDFIKDIFYKIDDSKISETYDFVLQNLPIFLKEEDYQRLDSLLNPKAIRSTLEQNKKDLVSPIGFIYKKYLIADPLHISNRVFTGMRINAVDSLYSVYNGYIFSKDNKKLLIFITSSHSVGETGKNELLANALAYNIKKIIERSDGKVAVTSFGAAIVGVSNASQIKRDSYISTTISIVLIVFLLGAFFKSIRSLLLILVPVAFGVAFSLALLFFIKGTISAIAIGAGSAILGIAINYTLHFLVHYKHCGSVELTIKDLVSPLLVGSVTTIGAFLSLLFVSAGALRDFGLFAALALSGTILFVLVFLPHFVRGSSATSSHYSAFFDHISEVRFDKNKWVILAIILLTVVFGFFSSHLTFESDMNKISYMTSEQKKAFNELSGFTNLSQKSIIHVSEGSDSNEALRNYEAAKIKMDSLVKIRNINSVSGVGDILMSDSLQIRKIDRWNEFWVNKKQTFRETFEYESLRTGFKENSFDAFFYSLDKKYTVKSSDELMQGSGFASGFIIDRPNRTFIITLLYITPQEEEVVKKTLSAQPGTFIFDRASATKATIGVLSNDFNFVLLVCALLVLVFLTLSFGRFELSLLTFIPMVIGWIWILGIMAIFNLKFNIVNIILATFIFGLGDDYSIFIMEGSIHEHSYKRKILNSYKLAVILSALTMFIGIGSLIFAKHPAMKSLAQVTIIGMVSVVIISYTIVPFLYRWLTYKKGEKRIMPITARNIINSSYSFTAFLIGSLYHSLLGFLLFKVTKPSDSKKLFFHKSLAFSAGFVVQRLPNVKTSVINHRVEDFLKPSVIISNHQSHIDLMLIMMLSPRIVILTNEWVWNSPFYGNIIKYADFYPVVSGIEKSIEHLSRLIEKGYSIMIFPEGTRSEDCSINRFHRGAFYLAEQLNLDILPILIHGMGHVLPKTDFLMRKGSVTVEILDRITRENKSYGESYSQRAKNVRGMYRSSYQRLASEIETPGYYADKLFHNYVYKGASVSTRVRIDLRKNNNYSEIIKLVPDNGRVLVLGAGIGTFPLMLSMVKPSLTIDAVEADEDKLALAGNCASCTGKISYIHDNPLNFEILQTYDAVLLVDCLSTFENAEQQQIIWNCVNHSSLVLLSDIEYNRWNKIRLKLRGNELHKVKSYYLSDFEQLSEGKCFSISQMDNIFAITRKE